MYIYIYLLQICLVCLSVCVSLTKGLWTKKLTWVICIWVKIKKKKCPSVPDSVRPSVRPETWFFFTKLDDYNCQLQLNETTKGKTKYMSILFIIRRDSMLYLKTIGQKIKQPSPFVWIAFLNVTIVTWLYISPMKRPRDMKFGVKLD